MIVAASSKQLSTRECF